MYADPLVFGEVKRIKKPLTLPVNIQLNTDRSTTSGIKVNLGERTPDTKNFQRKHLLDKYGRKRKRTDHSNPTRTHTIELPPPPKQTINLQPDSDNGTPTHSYTLRAHRKPETVRFNPRPARSTTAVVNYFNMDASDEHVSPTRKRKSPNLMRYPSVTVISAHKRMKRNVKSNITDC